MSIMRTPPPNRHPIDTQVATFSVELIAEAINFELSRDGQVYFVCNRIATLDSMKRIIERHVPDCRVAIGHGQMKPDHYNNLLTHNNTRDIVDMSHIIIEGNNEKNCIHFG